MAKKYNRRDANRAQHNAQAKRYEGADKAGWYDLGMAAPHMSDARQLVATCPVTGRQRMMVARDRQLDMNCIQKTNPIRARGFDLVHNNEGYNLRVARAKAEQRAETNKMVREYVKASKA